MGMIRDNDLAQLDAINRNAESERQEGIQNVLTANRVLLDGYKQARIILCVVLFVIAIILAMVLASNDHYVIAVLLIIGVIVAEVNLIKSASETYKTLKRQADNVIETINNIR